MNSQKIKQLILGISLTIFLLHLTTQRGISSAGQSACMACKRSSVRLRYSPLRSDRPKGDLFYARCFTATFYTRQSQTGIMWAIPRMSIYGSFNTILESRFYSESRRLNCLSYKAFVCIGQCKRMEIIHIINTSCLLRNYFYRLKQRLFVSHFAVNADHH